MTTNSPIASETVNCANGQCGRPLDTKFNQGYPDSTVPPGNIHKRYDLSLPPFQVVCMKCGHYTLRYQRNRPD
ncbi:MAG: hypothetical protein LZF86_100277 [Nitrospira sp.]|nr:MAG: hypothetical protein LZF86_100277 [Nitrospira sp.]